MPNPFSAAVSVAGRALLVAIFLLSTTNKIPNFEGTAKYMASEGVPASQLMLVGAITFLIAGSVSVALGYQSRFGAVLLLIFITLATYYFHDFWNVKADVADRAAEVQNQTIQFMKNLAIGGGLLMIIANGPGAGSLDGYLAAKSKAANPKPAN